MDFQGHRGRCVPRQHLHVGKNNLRYTQTSDVEGEVNGLLSYDRCIQKLRPEFLAKVHARVWEVAAQVAEKARRPFLQPPRQLTAFQRARPISHGHAAWLLAAVPGCVSPKICYCRCASGRFVTGDRGVP